MYRLRRPAVLQFQHTAARRRLVASMETTFKVLPVSTHSRPKAAGMGNGGDLDSLMFQHTAARRRLDETDRNRCRLCSFNTQPPEGGWRLVKVDFTVNDGFQHTAARRRLVPFAPKANRVFKFQHTAARRRLVEARIVPDITLYVSTHSRPKAAGKRLQVSIDRVQGSGFNTQPPEGGWFFAASKLLTS